MTGKQLIKSTGSLYQRLLLVIVIMVSVVVTQVAAIKTEKKAREQKRRNKTLESRRALANVRVVQNNLVFVVGLPVRLADPEVTTLSTAH